MTYEDNLKHVAEPASPSGRKKAVSATLEDYAALWLAEQMREYAHYGDPVEEHYTDIALAYVQFIDRKVRDQGKRHVTLYGHTDDAAEALMDVMFTILDSNEPSTLESTVDGAIRDIYVEHIERDVVEPEPVEDVAGGTVEFCDASNGEASDESASEEADEVEGAAMAAEADAAVAEAESEWEAEEE